MDLSEPSSWPTQATWTTTDKGRYGQADATSFDRMHPRLTHRGSWTGHDGPLPIVEGTVIRLALEHLPGQREAAPVWLWSSTTGADAGQVTRCWQPYHRRFDLKHIFRLFKQTLGWVTPKIRFLQAGGRWTWLIIAAHNQLRLPAISSLTCAGPGSVMASQEADRWSPRPIRGAVSLCLLHVRGSPASQPTTEGVEIDGWPQAHGSAPPVVSLIRVAADP